MINTHHHITVFGRLTEIIGAASLQWPVTPNTDELKASLEERFPELKGKTYAIAVDKKVAAGTVILSSASEIALLPPFSGG
jgi:molybdopterin synthase sulfur carrier subunit